MQAQFRISVSSLPLKLCFPGLLSHLKKLNKATLLQYHLKKLNKKFRGKLVFLNYFNQKMCPMWELIPERLQRQMKKSFLSGKSEINIDELKEEQLGSLQKQIAKMLYATRNSIVHAKSNYEPNGYELEGDELINGNRMMDVVALSVIQWNERQPESFRI